MPPREAHRIISLWPDGKGMGLTSPGRPWRMTPRYFPGDPDGVGRKHEGHPYGDPQTVTEVMHPADLDPTSPRVVIWVPDDTPVGLREGFSTDGTTGGTYIHLDHGTAEIEIGGLLHQITVEDGAEQTTIVVGSDQFEVTLENGYEGGKYVQLPGGAEAFYYDPKVTAERLRLQRSGATETFQQLTERVTEAGEISERTIVEDESGVHAYMRLVADPEIVLHIQAHEDPGNFDPQSGTFSAQLLDYQRLSARLQAQEHGGRNREQPADEIVAELFPRRSVPLDSYSLGNSINYHTVTDLGRAPLLPSIPFPD